MRIFPIIPIWLMILISFILVIIFGLKQQKKSLMLKQIIIIILLFIINLRIMIPNNNATTLSNNLDVLFVVDNTLSMTALDYKNNQPRLNGVKEDCKKIIDELSGARFSIITFNNISSISIPFTNDINITKEAIDVITPLDELYARGTNLDIPLEDMISSLKAAKEKHDNIRIVFYISDGEITDNQSIKSFKGLKKYIDNGAVLGYGSKNGGYMKVKDRFTGEESYVIDRSNYNYDKAISKINEDNLKKIATDMGINYIYMNEHNSLDNKLNDIKKIAKTSIDKNRLNSYTDIYYIFVIPLLIILVLTYREYEK